MFNLDSDATSHSGISVLKAHFSTLVFESLMMQLCGEFTHITFSHGLILGWLAPMYLKLQSDEENPLSFTISLEEASWVGALICLGGLLGNWLFGFTVDRFGRKPSLYGLAIPHALCWMMIYFASSVEYLYASRILAGTTGMGYFVVLPIFIGEISDSKVRGRLTSLFSLTQNTGILVGYILGTHLDYYIIPFVGISVPISFAILITIFPETPQFLLRRGLEKKAFKSFQFYKNVSQSTSKAENEHIENEFNELKMDILAQQTSKKEKITMDDFLNKKILHAIFSGLALILVNVFSGIYALISYMSSAFAMAKVELNPDTNTIIIGAVQIIGTCTAIVVVDRFGRKILLILSSIGMIIGLGFFGVYGYFAQETNVDLSAYSYWLPLLLMALSIFSANIGVIPLAFVLLVELFPAKIRSKVIITLYTSLSLGGFVSVKTFPICLHVFGLAWTMWMCAAVCATGLLLFAIFVRETKGKSINKD